MMQLLTASMTLKPANTMYSSDYSRVGLCIYSSLCVELVNIITYERFM